MAVLAIYLPQSHVKIKPGEIFVIFQSGQLQDQCLLGEIWARLAGAQGKFRAGSAPSDGELAASTLGTVVPQQYVAMAGSLALSQAVVWNIWGQLSACCPELGHKLGELQAVEGDFKPGNLYGRRGSVCMLVPAVHVSAMEKVSS